MGDTVETTEPVVEQQEDTHVIRDGDFLASPDNQDASNDNASSEDAAPTPEPSEEKPAEETYEQKVERHAKSISDKSLQTYQDKAVTDGKTISDQASEIAQLKLDAQTRTWDNGIDSVFKEDMSDIGEEGANKRKATLEGMKAEVLEVRNKEVKINQAMALLGNVELEPLLKSLGVKTLEEGANYLSGAHLKIMAMTDVDEMMNPDRPKEDKVRDAYIQKLSGAANQTDYNNIKEIIRETIVSKAKPSIPAGTHQGGGGVPYDPNNPTASVSAAFEKYKK